MAVCCSKRGIVVVDSIHTCIPLEQYVIIKHGDD